jgi:hypothetical protein
VVCRPEIKEDMEIEVYGCLPGIFLQSDGCRSERERFGFMPVIAKTYRSC